MDRPTPQRLENFRKSFAGPMALPLFVSPGNHDLMGGRKLYESAFGDLYFFFHYGEETYIFLDSEHIRRKDVANQILFLNNIFNGKVFREMSGTVFLFTHKLLWVLDRPDFRVVLDQVNNSSGYMESLPFARAIKKTISKLGAQRPIVWASGDIGVGGSLPLFYHEDPIDRITYLATGLNDSAQDLILAVSILKNRGSRVLIEPLSLSGKKGLALEDFGLEAWDQRFGRKRLRDIRLGQRKKSRILATVVAESPWLWAMVVLTAGLLIRRFLSRPQKRPRN